MRKKILLIAAILLFAVYLVFAGVDLYFAAALSVGVVAAVLLDYVYDILDKVLSARQRRVRVSFRLELDAAAEQPA